MNIDNNTFWDRFDESLKTDGRKLKELCESLSISYGTITQNRSQKKYPILRTQLYSAKLKCIARYLVFGITTKEEKNQKWLPYKVSRLQHIISVLLKPRKTGCLGDIPRYQAPHFRRWGE